MTGLELIFAATHHAVDGDFNESHIGLRYVDPPAVVALYENSEGNPSLMVGAAVRGSVGACASFGEVGLATGYSVAPIIPIGRVGVECGSTRVFAFPAVNNDFDLGFGLGFEVFIPISRSQIWPK